MDPSKETILFEYIPGILYTKQVLNGSTIDIGSDSGVIMIVMLNGDVFFYPSNVTLLDQLPDIFLNSPNTNNNGNNGATANMGSNNNNKSNNSSKKNNLKSKYNIPLNLSPDHKVFNFDFKQFDPSESFIYNSESSGSSSANNVINNNNNYNSDPDNIPAPHEFLDFNPIRYRRPRKILVSHDKRLLMIIGCFIKGVSCLTIYRIVEEGPNYFQLIFYDSSFTYVDACFSSDSTMMTAILARYPNFIFALQIPGLQPKQITNNIKYQEKRISFEARKIGPLAIVGPVKNYKGEPYHMTHIASNPKMSDEKLKPFEFVTWNDDSLGECCFWNIYKTPNDNNSLNKSLHQPSQSNQPSPSQPPQQPQSQQPQPQQQNSPLKNIPQLKFEWMTKFINPIVPDKSLIDKEGFAKSFIINMEFSPNGDLVMAIVRRENHDQKNRLSNGIGFQCIPSTLDLLNSSSIKNFDGTPNTNTNINNIGTENQNYFKNKTNQQKGTIGGEVSSQWFQLSESNDKSIIITSKWTDSLFFGGQDQYLPAVLIKEKGIYELVSNNYCAQFTNSSEEFIKTCVNFIQMGKYHRLWISTYGILYSITMTPKNDKYIDWIPTVFNSISNQSNILSSKYYKVSQMIGYNLIDFTKAQENSSKNPNKKKSTSISEERQQAEVYSCLHLYKCWSCKLTLIKPLICGYCKTVAYCSKECQKDHWLVHKEQCIPPTLPMIQHHNQLHQQLQQQSLQQHNLQQKTLQLLNFHQQNNKL
ncbi:hypothetical protein DICPUDRAFT_52183 [Dictyostelium purpureum]|uniref:MYND-type domain-containing protein n=1 Tax=Dictyostelium purpureum TaxID=5786 RepID=F0Z7C3_DICPU|nr:uncharacterized protein DICPUDRAFT_52183 [Dictyostelium purpureum]EGC40115.1 hypothetical protein DICPUDRAFT_52183 [Dictyostelium purpureum]|eukprot:XP_003283305.1 hypothetical protein DICPUDRAFT_52183 [Dictyostelium purpureum]